jgi:hypothetical protein
VISPSAAVVVVVSMAGAQEEELVTFSSNLIVARQILSRLHDHLLLRLFLLDARVGGPL